VLITAPLQQRDSIRTPFERTATLEIKAGLVDTEKHLTERMQKKTYSTPMARFGAVFRMADCLTVVQAERPGVCYVPSPTSIVQTIDISAFPPRHRSGHTRSVALRARTFHANLKFQRMFYSRSDAFTACSKSAPSLPLRWQNYLNGQCIARMGLGF